MVPAANTYTIVLDSPLGKLGLQLLDAVITRLDYLGHRVPLKPATTLPGKQINDQLENYFSDPQSRFSLPFELQGTDFQLRVWNALTQIPSGKTLTYGELADRLGSGARAVGNACRHNPLPIIVPCHRVISITGIGGYSGKTDGCEISRKKWLLSHEGIAGQALKIRHRTPTSSIQQ